MVITSNISIITVTPTSGDYVPPGYKSIPIFEDHFLGSTLDSTKWSYVYGTYNITNSNLILGYNDGGGMIRGLNSSKTNALFSFKYGYIVYRAKLADAGNNKGYNNQLWLGGDPQDQGEKYAEILVDGTTTGPIDNNDNLFGINKMVSTLYCYPGDSECIGENSCIYKADQPNAYQPCPDCNTSKCFVKAKIQRKVYNTGKDLSKGYHIYSCEWTPDFIRFLFDGIETVRYTQGITYRKMFLIAGLCKRLTGTQCWPASDIANVSAQSYIDYIRVYQK